MSYSIVLPALFVLVSSFTVAQPRPGDRHRIVDSVVQVVSQPGSEAGIWALPLQTVTSRYSPVNGFPWQNVARESDFSFTPTAADLVVGPGVDTLRITQATAQRGNIFVLGQGVLIVDAAELSVAGHLAAAGNGTILARNGARIHFDQQYVAQYYVHLTDDARFEATDATVDCNGSIHFVNVLRNSTYVARRTAFPDWTFRTIRNKAHVVLEDIRHVGDFLVNDSCDIRLVRCDTLMPWFQTPAGSTFDVQFPEPDLVEHYEVSGSTPGVSGIAYRCVVDSCRECWWSIESFPGSATTIRASTIRGCAVRLPGADTIDVAGILNNRLHTDLSVPVPDRQLRFVDSYVTWWNWYPMQTSMFRMDSCVFGELVGKGSSLSLVSRSIHDGMTVMLGTIDSAVMVCSNSASAGFVASFHASTLLLVNSVVTPLRPYQKTNIAHGSSRLFCVNSRLVSRPFALDSALVMFASIDSVPKSPVGTSIPIRGSAWISAGPSRPVALRDWRLDWRRAVPPTWRPLVSSTTAANDTMLAEWDTQGYNPGQYLIRLVVRTDGVDTLVAYMQVILDPVTAIDIPHPVSPTIRLAAYPNPFRASATIEIVAGRTRESTGSTPADAVRQGAHRSLKVYDILGREILDLTSRLAGSNRAMIRREELPAVGRYVVRLATEGRNDISMIVFSR